MLKWSRLSYRRLCSARRLSVSAKTDKRFTRCVNKLLAEFKTLQSEEMNNSLNAERRSRLVELMQPAQLCTEFVSTQNDLEELSSMLEAEEDGSMSGLLREEERELVDNQEQLTRSILNLLCPVESDKVDDVILEVHAGVGGVEAGLFAYELYRMYERYCLYKGWSVQLCAIQAMEGPSTSTKAVNKVQVEISGRDVYKLLKFESGIHRVQRVPSTEKSGRMHTSTAVIVLLPKPNEIDISIDQKDIKWDVFRSRGGGGQSVNTTESAVRVTHLPTGTVVECQQERSQIKNKKIAMDHLKSRLYEHQLSVQQANTSSQRRLQIGGANRNEKIRTYNFMHDRITDHRVKSVHSGINSFLEGGAMLDEFVGNLVVIDQQERFHHWLEEFDRLPAESQV